MNYVFIKLLVVPQTTNINCDSVSNQYMFNIIPIVMVIIQEIKVNVSLDLDLYI